MNKTLIYSTLLVAMAASSMADTWLIDSDEDWKKNQSKQENLEFKNGMASPLEKDSFYQSKIKQFKKAKNLKTLTIDQSPIWQNWNSVENLGPSNLGDAPVFLSLGPNDYWIFGRYRAGTKKQQKAFQAEEVSLDGYDETLKTTKYPNQFNAPSGLKASQGGYHAWHSRDMKNWVHYGSITDKVSRWMTTAEYVDGKFYFYYDYPNDQDPHLYIDSNLKDGEPGENKGLAFKDPSDGSDCTFFRDKDGKFHVIYEDWSPIDANKRSWDSPLAGHAVSEDGISDFKILSPAVDNRTSPTGKFAEYKHPHWLQHPDWDSNIARYEIHEGEQEAYGDWASIKIGGQYYLFGDYDPVGGHQMSTGWFTSDSLDKQFKWCDHIGSGHPDPDIGFANGEFQLITQQKNDYTSPGPWVESVEVRVGIDSSNDGVIDRWTDWAEVKESYDYTPGFAKHVQKIAAAIDLSSLSKAYGVQFELKIKDTTENKSKPILDKLMIEYK
ncbi:hypothetical protein [Lentisphaera profundi]